MTLSLKERLTLALLDEYKSRATYARIIEKFGPVRPFVNIHEAEGRHVAALIRLFEAHGIEAPIDHWPCHVTVPATLADACREAIAAEQDNILHAAKFSVFENSWNFSVISVCIWLLKRVPRSRRQVSMLSLKWANVS